MAAQSLFLVHETRYTRAQLRRIYKRHARSMGWTTHAIMLDLYIDAWQQKRVGPVGDAIAAFEASGGRGESIRAKIYAAAVVSAVGVVFCLWHWS